MVCINISSLNSVIKRIFKTYVPENIQSNILLKFGDIFTYETDSDGYLSRFCKLYEYNPQAQPDEDGRLFMSAAGGTGTAKNIFVVQGTVRYKSSDKIVLSLTNGELSLMPFTRGNSEYACVVNTASEKIRLIPIDQLEAQNFYSNTPGDFVIVQATRHQLKEVIIYE